MARENRNRFLRGWQWWLQHNPMYLASAVCMAEGARLYLVHPSARAGDVGLILLVLGVLQAYEWAVVTILLALHRSHRSPEDEPSLMLVAALFWTGPLAATAEMTAHRGDLGLITALGAAAVALIELAVVRRAITLRIGGAARLAAGACVLLLVAAPPLVRIPAVVDGRNELFLYAAWWILAAIALLGALAARSCDAGRYLSAPPGRTRLDPGVEFGLLGIVLAATAAHLVAMNYAYFGNARLFYCSPLLVALAVVGMIVVAVIGSRVRGWIVLAAILPAVAIALAWQPFAPQVPVTRLPFWLRDPLFLICLIAAAAWWYGGYRLRVPVLVHAGSAACVGAVVRMASRIGVASPTVHALMPADGTHRDLVVIALYGVAIYLGISAVLRRSRIEGVAALVVHQAAVTLWVWDRVAADVFIVGLVGGWSWLVALHLLVRNPRLAQAIWPLALLMLVTWGRDFDDALRWLARLHGAFVVLVLLAANAGWPRVGYRYLAAGCGSAHGLFLAGRVLAAGPHATEACVVAGAFALLAGGAAISWFKRLLLQRVQPASGLEVDTSSSPGGASP